MNEFYLVQSTSADGVTFTHEVDLDKSTREAVVTGIATGDYDIGRIDRVIKIDLGQGQAVDISVLIASEVERWSYAQEREVSQTALTFLQAYGMDPYVEPEPEPMRHPVRRGHLYPYFGALSR